MPSNFAPSDSPSRPLSPSVATWSAGSLLYDRRALLILFGWLLVADFVWSLRDRSVGPMAQWYLKNLGVPNSAYALIMSSLPAALSLFFIPIISYKSDRHRGPQGRRKPFLLLAVLIAAVGIVLLGLCPFLALASHEFLGASSPGVNTLAIVWVGLLWGVIDFSSLAAQAVFGGLINDVVPRSLLGRFYGLFRAVSLAFGIAFNYWILGLIETRYTLIMVTIGILYGLGFVWVCFKVKEGTYPPPPAEDPARPGPLGVFWGASKTYYRECFSKSYYIWIFVMMTAAHITMVPINLFSVPYAKNLGMSMDLYGKCLALTFTISLCLSYFVGWLSDLIHPLRATAVFLVGYAGVMLWGSFNASTPSSFAVAFVLHGVFSGSYYTSAASLGQRLYPSHKYAQFASAAALLISMTSLVMGPLVGSIIDLSGNDYRFTFTAGFLVCLCALVAIWRVYGRFMGHGGHQDYKAPE